MLFPYEELERQIQKFGVYAIYVGPIFLPIINKSLSITTNEEEDLITEDLFQIPDDSKRAYNRMVVDLFDDLARLGCI